MQIAEASTLQFLKHFSTTMILWTFRGNIIILFQIVYKVI